MAVATSSAFDLEIQTADGSWLGLMLARPLGQDGQVVEGQPVSLQETLEASDDDLPVAKKLTVVNQEDWSGGVGLAYNVAPGCRTQNPGFVVPAGLVTDVTIPATHNSASDINALAIFNGDLFVAQRGTGAASTGRVMRSVGQTGALADTTLLLPANDQVFDMVVFTDTNKAPVSGTLGNYLYASSNINGKGRLHRWNGSIWESTNVTGVFGNPAGSSSRRKLGKAYWVDADGIGSWRMITTDGDLAISYTTPGDDPMQPSSWVDVVVIQGGAADIVASRRHAYFPSTTGVFDLDGMGDSPNIAPFMEFVSSNYSGRAACYFDGALYVSSGNTMVKIPVDQGTMVQDFPGYCGPGYGTAAESEYIASTGITSVVPSEGGIYAALWNNVTQRASVFWGQDRNIAKVDTPNPLVWHGPEFYNTDGSYVTEMLVSQPAGVENPRLWLATSVVGGSPGLSWASLPLASAPISDARSVGSHRFSTGSGTGRWNPYSRLYLLEESFGDRASRNAVYAHTLVTRGLGSGTKLTFEDRADAAPSSTAYTTSTDVTVSPSQTITPATVTAGNRIGRLISFVSPSGGSTPPVFGVLDACRSTAFKTVPSFGVRHVVVEYGSGVLNLENVEDDQRDPDDVSAQLLALTGLDRTVVRDRSDKRWDVHLFQVFNRTETFHEGAPYRKTVRAELEIVRLGRAS